MLKWLLTTVLALFLFSAAVPWLARWFGFGRMPGDLRFSLAGRNILVPLASTIILSLLAWLLGRVV